jgi:NitT/TauT family transport system substrate-binding protein
VSRTNRSFLQLLALLTVALVVFAACGGDDDGGGSSGGSSDGSSSDDFTLRLGYFPNVTHAPALVGLQEGFIEADLPDGTSLETLEFNAGGEAIEAMLAGEIDATYIGPNPAINGYATDSDLLRIVSGATSGGAYFVVDDDIQSAADLEGKTVATPSLGNTQDVALRAWLAGEGYETNPEGGGDVNILPQENSATLTAFQAGEVDGAWVPEPWATRLIEEGGGHVLVDEADLWPDGEYVTTHMIVTKELLDDHPDVVQGLIEANIESIEFIEADAAATADDVAAQILEATTQEVSTDLVTTTLGNLTFTWDPIASSLATSAADAEELGLLDPVDLDGIYDLTILNQVLAEQGKEAVSDT